MKYDIIYCDPPWLYDNPKDHKAAMGGTPYLQISQEDLKKLPILDIAEKNSIMFMWATLPKLPEAFEMMKAWNFKFTTVPFVWVKLNGNGKIVSFTEWIDEHAPTFGEYFPSVWKAFKKLRLDKTFMLIGGIYSGLGHWTCGNIELVLMGKRGSPKRITKSIKQIVFAPVSKHSRKPDEVRQRIKQLMGNNLKAIEIFATEKVDGWDSIGNEVDGLDITESLQLTIDKE